MCFERDVLPLFLSSCGISNCHDPGIAEGDLTIRGETEPVETSGTLEIKGNGKINATSKFNIDIDAYGIKIPKLVKDKIVKNIKIICDMDYELYNR